MDFRKIEFIFFSVIEDLKEYIPDLTIVNVWS